MECVRVQKAKVFALFRRRWRARRPLAQCEKGRKEGPWELSPHCPLTGSRREPVNVVVSKFTVSGGGTLVQKPDMALRNNRLSLLCPEILGAHVRFTVILCRFLKIRNCELQALLPFLRGIELEGIDSFEESIPGDESIPLWNRFL